MKPTVYNEAEIREQLQTISEWCLSQGEIERSYSFLNFSEALAFIVRVGIEAEKMDHHPEIKNVYNRVWIRLHTHSVKGVTPLDIDLAHKIETIFQSSAKK